MARPSEHARRPLRSRLSLWLPVVAWIVVIGLMSGDAASQSGTEGPFLDFLSGWWPGLATALQDAPWWSAAGWAVRKVAHLAEYGILALLVLRALRGGTRLSGATATAATVVICVVVAAGDELHQATVASRSGSPVDVGIDLLGVLLALLLSSAFAGMRARRTRP